MPIHLRLNFWATATVSFGYPKQLTISVYQLIEGEYVSQKFRESDRVISGVFLVLTLTADLFNRDLEGAISRHDLPLVPRFTTWHYASFDTHYVSLQFCFDFIRINIAVPIPDKTTTRTTHISQFIIISKATIFFILPRQFVKQVKDKSAYWFKMLHLILKVVCMPYVCSSGFKRSSRLI